MLKSLPLVSHVGNACDCMLASTWCGAHALMQCLTGVQLLCRTSNIHWRTQL